MKTSAYEKEIGTLVEQKILEFFGDPDAGRALKKGFAAELRERLKKRQQKLTPLSAVARKYCLR